MPKPGMPKNILGNTLTARMTEDFTRIWPHFGAIKGMGVPGYVEVRSHAVGLLQHHRVEKWFPGTLQQHNRDDTFDVLIRKDSVNPNAPNMTNIITAGTSTSPTHITSSP